MKNRIIFIHGGPGLHSLAENFFWGKRAEELNICFYHTPSSLRPGLNRGTVVSGRAFENSVAGICDCVEEQQEKVVLLAHSFGCWAALHAAARLPEKILKVIVVSPAHPIGGFKNIIRKACEDFATLERQDDSEMLRQLLDKISDQPDETFFKAFELTMSDPLVTMHYFSDMEILQRWGSFMQSDPCHAVDQQVFRAELIDYFKTPLPQNIDQPVTVICGSNDITSPDGSGEKLMQPYASKVNCVTIEKGSHMLHLDQWRKFLDIVEREMENVA